MLTMIVFGAVCGVVWALVSHVWGARRQRRADQRVARDEVIREEVRQRHFAEQLHRLDP